MLDVSASPELLLNLSTNCLTLLMNLVPICPHIGAGR